MRTELELEIITEWAKHGVVLTERELAKLVKERTAQKQATEPGRSDSGNFIAGRM